MINIAFNAFNYNVLHHLNRKNMFKNIFFIAYNSVCFYIYLWQYFLTSTWTISATVRLAQWAKLRVCHALLISIEVRSCGILQMHLKGFFTVRDILVPCTGIKK